MGCPADKVCSVQIEKTRGYYSDAEDGIAGLDPKAKWPVWAALIVYRKILDAIEANEFDNITKRAYVAKPRKMTLLPWAWACAALPQHARRISKLV
jgi:15-cis-phytoene synthase